MKVSKEIFACAKCHIMESENYFIKNGCPNCKDYQNYKDQMTKEYKGWSFIVMPKNSTISKSLKLDENVPGQYAMICGEDL